MRPLGWAVLILGALTITVLVIVIALTGSTADPTRSGLIAGIIALGTAGTAAVSAIANRIDLSSIPRPSLGRYRPED